MRFTMRLFPRAGGGGGMGFEVEIGPQEISTQSGKKTYIVEVACVWLGNFFEGEFFLQGRF